MVASPRLEALASPLRDLSRWNRLLSLPSDRRSGYLTFLASVRSVWEILAGGGSVPLVGPEPTFREDWSDERASGLGDEAVRARLHRLEDLAGDLSEETGVSPLSLALGLVLWRDGGRVRSAPLMHCPVKLEGMAGAPSVRRFGSATLNPLLVDRLGIDVAALPADPLLWRVSDLEAYGVVGIVPVATLGLFDLARYRQWQWAVSDVEASRPGSSAVVRLLEGEAATPWPQKLIRRPLRKGKRYGRLVASLDHSQAMAVSASRRGLSFVVEGGPGSGKTQTIAHIVGNALRDRRSVLFLGGRMSAFRALRDRFRGKMSDRAIVDLSDGGLDPETLAKRLGVRPADSIRETLERVEMWQRIVMATPASLALHMPRGWAFDLVVFDEATLIPVVEALQAVAACRQVVICGDSQQMQKDPPLHVLFDREVPYVPKASLIEAALAAGMPVMTLSHHYRSRHPTLMHHTNRIYYDGMMRLCPSPMTDGSLGVRAARVDGSFAWDTITNAVEAEAVVDALEAHVANGRGASVAVIAMTMQQRDLIRRRIAERGIGLAGVEGREPVLIADYNGIQGEERDVVLVSFVFGPAPGETAWPTSYGALSLPGGEKRLDVIMSRARERLLIWTSFPRESIRVGLSVAHRNLRAYLECASQVDRDEALPYEGLLKDIAGEIGFDCLSYGNAVGIIDARTRAREVVAAVYVTGVVDPLIAQSEIAQYRNSGWRVVEMTAEEVEASSGDIALRKRLAMRLLRACAEGAKL